MKSKDTFDIPGKGTVFAVPWFEGWENIVNKELEIDGNLYKVKGAERNVCGGFFIGTDEQWEKRDVYILV